MSASGSSADGDEPSPATREDDGVDDLPERIIVVREPTDDDVESSGHVEDEVASATTFDLDPPEDPAELQDELEAFAVEMAVDHIDLDEVDLRTAGDPSPTEEADPPLAGDQDEDPPLAVVEDEAPDDEDEGEPLEGDDDVDAPDEEDEPLEGDDDVDAPDEEDEPVASVASVASDHPEAEEAWFGDVGSTEEADVDAARAEASERRAELDALLRGVPESQVRGVEARSSVPASPVPGRDETDPGTLRPKAPEPVIAARRISSSPRTRRRVSRVRSLLVLVVVVVLAGVGLAGAIGAAVLLVVLVLSRAFGSG